MTTRYRITPEELERRVGPDNYLVGLLRRISLLATSPLDQIYELRWNEETQQPELLVAERAAAFIRALNGSISADEPVNPPVLPSIESSEQFGTPGISSAPSTHPALLEDDDD